jgi:hypothetical protein
LQGVTAVEAGAMIAFTVVLMAGVWAVFAALTYRLDRPSALTLPR